MEQYQDIWIKGSVTPGVRECAARYPVIKKVLEQYKRPFTVLDIGANLGYFSFRIAEDFPEATCVLIESKYGKHLTQLGKDNESTNVIILNNTLTADKLINLSQCEHFDVILCLNIIHHLDDPTKSIAAIEKLGETVIIETPSPNDKGACGQTKLTEIYSHVEKNYSMIGSFSRHTSNSKSLMGVKKFNNPILEKAYWDASIKRKNYLENLVIESDFKTKTYNNKKNTKIEKRDWIPGINLRTYQYLNGTYPSKDFICRQIENLDFSNHNDIAPWNIIVTGNDLSLIDFADPKQKDLPVNNLHNKENIIAEIKASKIESVKKYKVKK